MENNNKKEQKHINITYYYIIESKPFRDNKEQSESVPNTVTGSQNYSHEPQNKNVHTQAVHRHSTIKHREDTENVKGRKNGGESRREEGRQR